MKIFPLLLIAILSANLPLLAQPTDQASLFNPEVKRVAVFKNGYAFTYREGEVHTGSGWAYTTRTPIGVLGTVWGFEFRTNNGADKFGDQ